MTHHSSVLGARGKVCAHHWYRKRRDDVCVTAVTGQHKVASARGLVQIPHLSPADPFLLAPLRRMGGLGSPFCR